MFPAYEIFQKNLFIKISSALIWRNPQESPGRKLWYKSYTEVPSKPHKADGYNTPKNEGVCVLLALSKLTQSHSKTARDPAGCCWPRNRRWGYLMEIAKEGATKLSATSHPPDRQFWTSLWLPGAQSYWALTSSSRCPFRYKALRLPCHFQSLRPASFMLSFPISAHGSTDASKSPVTSCSVHPCATDQYCEPSRSNSNQQTAILKPFYSWRISVPCQELLKSSLPDLHTRLLWSQN